MGRITRQFVFLVRLILIMASVGSLLADEQSSDVIRERKNSSENAGGNTFPGAIKKLVEEGKLPGALLLTATDGKISRFDAVGFRDVARRRPVEKDTIFRFYSISKPIIAAAVMVLVDDGVLSLDDPVEKHLPSFSSVRVYVRDDKGTPVTRLPTTQLLVGHLLTHTSGLSYVFMPTPVSKFYKQAGISGAGGEAGFTNLADWTSAVASLPLLADPGEQWNYSVGIDVAGHLIEVVSGKSLGEFLQNRLFTPLEMIDTSFRVKPVDADRVASLYRVAGEGLSLLETGEAAHTPNTDFLELGGAGLVGTATDYFRFAQMLLNYGELDGERVLSRESVERILSDKLSDSSDEKPLSGLGMFHSELACNGIGFGYGGFVVVSEAPGCLWLPVGSYGWAGAASTYFWVDPGSKSVAILFSQVLGGGRYGLLRSMACAIYGTSCE